jgi:putative oxidoreductase
MFKNKRARLQNTQLLDDVHGSGLKPQGDPLMPERVSVDYTALETRMAEPELRDRAQRSRSALETTAHLAGRAIFGGFFLYNGINHFRNREMLAGYASSKKVPAADAAVIASGVMMVAGGLSLLTGAQPKIGAASIAGFLLGVSPTMHAYWNEQDPQQRMHEMVNFTKNVALIGGALLAAGQPEPWPWSVGRRPNGELVRGHA